MKSSSSSSSNLNSNSNAINPDNYNLNSCENAAELLINIALNLLEDNSKSTWEDFDKYAQKAISLDHTIDDLHKAVNKIADEKKCENLDEQVVDHIHQALHSLEKSIKSG